MPTCGYKPTLEAICQNHPIAARIKWALKVGACTLQARPVCCKVQTKGAATQF